MLPALRDPTDRPALDFAGDRLTYRELASVAGALAAELAGRTRVAVWATPSLHTAVGVVAALAAGVPAVPVNPKVGERELGPGALAMQRAIKAALDPYDILNPGKVIG
ncbi:AMP-binding protein [Pseudonocardia acidicola]|uniref:AMP-binding protein n=1 Tax=Pseudonocardia acidicola TaxID=2724939 RepID=UPI001B7CF816